MILDTFMIVVGLEEFNPRFCQAKIALQVASTFCPECKGTRLVQDMAEVACSDCGCVVEPVISLGPERRSFAPEDGMERARTGPPSTLQFHDRGLSTIIATMLKIRNRQLNQGSFV